MYLTQIRDSSDSLPPLLPPASPHGPPFVPPFVAPMAIPLPYPALIRGNVLPVQPFVSGHPIVVSLLSHPEETKDDLKSVTEQSVTVDEPSVRSEGTETS